MPNYSADPGSCRLDGSIRAVSLYQGECLKLCSRCDLSQCPRCGAPQNGESSFRRHAVRLRFVLVTVERLVYRVPVRLARWRCSVCRRTFTNYPSFMFRYKYYVLPEMRTRVITYACDEEVSYRRGVTESALPIFHRDAALCDSSSSERQRESEHTPVLAHATLFRWVTSLGSRKVPRGCLAQRSVSPRKYRTTTRLRVLQSCLAFRPGCQ
jgi:hypothetical protein